MLYVPATSAGWPGAGLANRGLQHMRAAIANVWPPPPRVAKSWLLQLASVLRGLPAPGHALPANPGFCLWREEFAHL